MLTIHEDEEEDVGGSKMRRLTQVWLIAACAFSTSLVATSVYLVTTLD